MRDRVRNNSFEGPWEHSFAQELPFKISVTSVQTLRSAVHYPSLFEIGMSEYGVLLDGYLEYRLIGTSEEAVASVDSMWLGPLLLCCGCEIWRNQSDDSSQKRDRPDAVLTVCGALVLRVEEKASELNLSRAIKEITEKMHPSARDLFPAGYSSFPAIVSSPTLNKILSVSSSENGKFYTTEINSYRMDDINIRIEFVRDLFKIARWIVSVRGPSAIGSGIVPNVRLKTRNGHHVTLTQKGLLKEFKNVDTDRQQVMSIIYENKLPHVEHGECRNSKVAIIHRVGIPLEAKRYDYGTVVEHIRLALEELHNIGYAHCDVCKENVFYSTSDGVYFLGDLEYCRPALSPPRTDLRRYHPCATSEDLDMLQLEELKGTL